MQFRIAFLVCLFLVAAACTQPAPAPKADLVAAEKAIRDADAKWLQAAKDRDAAGEAAAFASDGVAYREHMDPIVGSTALQAYATKINSENPKQTVSWTTDKIEIAESGDLAVQTGEFHAMNIGAKGDGEDKGRFVTVWKKVGDTWKVAHDIGSTTMPDPKDKKK